MHRSIVPLTCVVAVVLSTVCWAGELSVRPIQFVFNAELSGEEEVPTPVQTETTGEAVFRVLPDRVEYTLRLRNGNGILSVAGAHIHCAPRGENGPVSVFLAGAAPGGYDGDRVMHGSFNERNVAETPCGSTLEDLVRSMLDGQTYVNVHGAENPPGVVRGQIERTFRSH